MQPSRVLLVEDDEDDAFLSKRSLKKAMDARGITYDLEHVRNGKAALDRLFQGEVLRAPNFDLVLLDLMMPIMDGKETLEAIRQHPQGYKIPVVVLTTSDNHREIDLVWGHGVSAYILKPVTAADYASIMDSTGTLFLRHNRSVR